MKDERKKLIIIGAGIIGLVILIVIVLLIIHAFTGSKLSYKGIEDKVLSAAKKYYRDNETLLPQNEGGVVTIDDAALTSAGYLKSMSELTEDLDGVTCSAKVIVSRNNDRLRYIPLLDCGEKYISKTLSSYIQNNVEKVYAGDGLYELNGEYVYRGESPNNYIKFSDKLYRIVKVTNDRVMIILEDKLERTTWDDRYNTDRERNDGINDYTVSRIKERLEAIYEENKLISEDDKSLVDVQTLYIGKRNETDNYNDGSIEKSLTYENQHLGLLPLYDYINASIDNNCASAITKSCTNYNYLNSFEYNWWTITADSSNTYKTYRIFSDGEIDTIKASSAGYIRPVIYLVSDALYVDGDGSQDNPYIVK